MIKSSSADKKKATIHMVNRGCGFSCLFTTQNRTLPPATGKPCRSRSRVERSSVVFMFSQPVVRFLSGMFTYIKPAVYLSSGNFSRFRIRPSNSVDNHGKCRYEFKSEKVETVLIQKYTRINRTTLNLTNTSRMPGIHTVVKRLVSAFQQVSIHTQYQSQDHLPWRG